MTRNNNRNPSEPMKLLYKDGGEGRAREEGRNTKQRLIEDIKTVP